MKRLILSLIILFAFLFVVACAENEEENIDETAVVDETTNDGVEETAESDQSIEETVEEEEFLEEITEPQYKVEEDASIVPIQEDGEENVVLLTIDDIPDKNALEMAETLSELGAGAIFFPNGHFLETEEQQEQLKQIHDMGFIIGNHTYSHPVLPDIPEEEQYVEIVELNDLIEEIIGERPKFFRAPHGMNSDYSISVAEEEGMIVMNWTYGYDYFEPYMDAEKLAEAMITGEGPEVDINYSLLKPGANLLMHDRDWTNEALEDIVIGLRDSGYEIVDPVLIKVN